MESYTQAYTNKLLPLFDDIQLLQILLQFYVTDITSIKILIYYKLKIFTSQYLLYHKYATACQYSKFLINGLKNYIEVLTQFYVDIDNTDTIGKLGINKDVNRMSIKALEIEYYRNVRDSETIDIIFENEE